MCSDGPPPPDPLIGQAAAANAEISKQALDYYKAKDIADKPYRDEAIQIALDQARTQVGTAKKQNDMADETAAYAKSTFRPLEQKIATDALGYDTPARREAEAAQAQADVGSAVDAERGNLIREVQSRGGDVNSGNFTASLAGMSGKAAAVKAAAGNQARKNVETVASAKLADAANLGRGIASTNATQTQLGLQAGNSAVTNSKTPLDISAQQGSQYAQGAGLAIQGNSSAGNLALGQYNAQNQAAGNSDSAWGALGNVAGSFAGSKAGSTAIASIFSDKTMKNNRKPVSGEVSLAALRKVPVEKWQYKKGSPGDDGGKTHVGPMAQAYNRALGNATAPDGKKVDLITLSGHQTGAIQALEKRLIRLENARPAKKKARA